MTSKEFTGDGFPGNKFYFLEKYEYFKEVINKVVDRNINIIRLWGYANGAL